MRTHEPLSPAGAPGRRPRSWRWQLVLAGLLVATNARSEEVLVAVAANFAGPMARIAEAFTAATGHTVKLSSGSTGKFYGQITSGAPFGVLLSADDETPRKLVAEGHAVAGTAFTYALGRLVLYSARPGLVDAHGAVLASGRFARLSIANPRVAPYGQAAMKVIKARGLTDAVAPKLVTGESIAQAFQFVASGNAELGFVALSQVAAPGQAVAGSYWVVPPSLYGEIRQDAVLLKPGVGRPAAAALLAYLKSPPARALIQAWGYGLTP